MSSMTRGQLIWAASLVVITFTVWWMAFSNQFLEYYSARRPDDGMTLWRVMMRGRFVDDALIVMAILVVLEAALAGVFFS